MPEGSEYTITNFRNNSEFDLDMVYQKVSYGVCPAHGMISVPRFVAEFWARKNLLFELAEATPEAEEIEKEKAEIAGAEAVNHASVEDKEEDTKKLSKKAAKKAKDEADAVLQEEEDESDVEPEETEETVA